MNLRLGAGNYQRADTGRAAICQSQRKDRGPAEGTAEKQVEMLNQLAADPKRSVVEICKTLGISRMTYYRYVKTTRFG